MIDHIHSGRKEYFHAGLCCSIGNTFGQEALTHAGVANQNDVLFLLNKLQVHKVYDSIFLFFSGEMEIEIELVDSWFIKEFWLFKSQCDPVFLPCFQFKIKKVFDNLKGRPVFLFR